LLATVGAVAKLCGSVRHPGFSLAIGFSYPSTIRIATIRRPTIPGLPLRRHPWVPRRIVQTQTRERGQSYGSEPNRLWLLPCRSGKLGALPSGRDRHRSGHRLWVGCRNGWRLLPPVQRGPNDDPTRQVRRGFATMCHAIRLSVPSRGWCRCAPRLPLLTAAKGARKG